MTKKQKDLVEEVKTKLKAEIANSDTEMAHVNADDLLCELLVAFGMKDVVDLYNEVGKWYA